MFGCNRTEKSLVPDFTGHTDSIQTSNTNEITQDSGNIWVDKLSNISYSLPDSIGRRPVSFYLNSEKVDPLAKAFYRGNFRPVDNDSTTHLLSLVITDNSDIRPFYRWCLDFTISISDGALGEYPGEPALKYATKFPEEFFAYMDLDTAGERYKQWTEIIAYSGLEDYSPDAISIQKNIESRMKKNCGGCNTNTKSRIHKFASDISAAVKLAD